MDRFDRIFELNRLLQSARHPVSRRRIHESMLLRFRLFA